MLQRQKGPSVKEWFARFAHKTAMAAGNYIAFVLAATVVVVWAVTGPLFKFSTTWQLVINTGTTIVTFLMVFLIQNSQNRDAEAIQLKLDELIRAVGEASNRLIDVEEGTEDDLNKLREEYKHMRTQDSATAPEAPDAPAEDSEPIASAPRGRNAGKQSRPKEDAA
jgi:low affinity Fe/Cu permease